MPGSKGAGWLDARMEDAPASAVMTPIRLERREPARNRQRFYNIAATRTLFDGRALVRETWFETESAAIEATAVSATARRTPAGRVLLAGGG